MFPFWCSFKYYFFDNLFIFLIDLFSHPTIVEIEYLRVKIQIFIVTIVSLTNFKICFLNIIQKYNAIMIQLPAALQNFITLFLGIVIESLPFVVLGVIVSVLVALFVSEDVILKLLPKNRYASHIFFALVGIFIPVCQCGNIPVARRFVMKGLSSSQAITFLLAAPVVNPITILTTYFAFC
jgi:uncharacterized membrane protein YraQ (UPF0718 family)